MPTLDGLQRIAFGTFEVDPQTGELWRAGFRVRLAGQPFKVLLVLLERPGEVVTREELLARVWGSNTNVDFEQAISGTVKKIREALGDSAENPRFVETLPKRGYRFIAPVTVVGKLRDPAHDEVAVSVPTPGTLPHVLPASGVGTILLPAASTEETRGELDLETLGARTFGVTEPASRRGRFLSQPLPLTWGWSSREKWLLCLAILFLAAFLAERVRPGPQIPSAPYRITQVTHYVPLSIGAPNVESFLTLAQDGDRILTSVLVDGRSRLSALYASTGGVQRISMPEEIASGTLADITRDGSKLLVRSNLSSASEQPLWIVPSSGGSGQRVASVLAHDATWMPDGTSVLYANENELRVIGQDDEVSVLYVKLEGRAFWLRWSPDGKLLRFTLMNPVTHATSLWEMESKDRVPRPVPEPSAAHLNACCGTWTADATTYVFQANNNLWKLADSGSKSKLSQLTDGPLRFISPVASRSGSRIYFVGLEAPSGLQQFDEKHHYFEPAPAFLADANRIEYSRDGRWVAWTDLDENLWRAHADGTDKVRLTSAGTEVFLAHWSPDGRRLAIMAREHGGLWQTYLVNAAGGSPEALLKETRNTADPSWSPDGEHLVYGREPDLMGKESGPRNLQVLNLVTHQSEVVPGSDGLFSPRWSPDGQWIVALTLDQKTLMLYDVKLRHWRQLAATSAADPVWSSDSKAIYLHAFQQDGEPILRVDTLDGSMHTIADLKNFHDGEAANYFFGGLTPANEPLVQPRIGTGNLYALDLSRAGSGS